MGTFDSLETPKNVNILQTRQIPFNFSIPGNWADAPFQKIKISFFVTQTFSCPDPGMFPDVSFHIETSNDVFDQAAFQAQTQMISQKMAQLQTEQSNASRWAANLNFAQEKLQLENDSQAAIDLQIQDLTESINSATTQEQIDSINLLLQQLQETKDAKAFCIQSTESLVNAYSESLSYSNDEIQRLEQDLAAPIFEQIGVLVNPTLILSSQTFSTSTLKKTNTNDPPFLVMEVDKSQLSKYLGISCFVNGLNQTGAVDFLVESVD